MVPHLLYNESELMSALSSVIRYLRKNFFQRNPPAEMRLHPRVHTAPSGTQSIHIVDLIMSERVCHDMDRLDRVVSRSRPKDLQNAEVL